MRIQQTLLLALLILAPAAHADVCDDVNDIANGWNEIANALEEDAGEGLEDLDLDRLRRDVDDLLPGTESFGEFLVAEGDARERQLGNNLLDSIEDLYDVDTDDYASYLVDRIDDIVDDLDDTVDFCDFVSE